VTTEKVYWFAVNTGIVRTVDELSVERFDTLDQAQLYAAAMGWRVPFADYPHGEHMNDPGKRSLYDTYLFLSRKPK